MWYLNGRLYTGGDWGPNIPAGWNLEDLADFNHDGRPDWLLSSDRYTAMWYLNGNIFLGSAYGPTISVGWHLARRPCSYSLSTNSVNVPQAASTNHIVYVSTLSFGCPWQAISYAPWIHLYHGQSWTGSGYVAFSTDANTSGTPRVGYILIAGQWVTVNQAGIAYGSIVITSQTWTPNGDGTYEVVVTGTVSIAANLEADLFTYPANGTCGTWISTSWPTDHRSLNDPATTTWTFCFHYAGNYQPYVLLRTNVGNVVYDYYVYPHW